MLSLYHIEVKPYIKVDTYQSVGWGIWKAENLDQNRRKGCELGNKCLPELKPLGEANM